LSRYFLPTFGILGPLPISGMVEARNFKDVHKRVQTSIEITHRWLNLCNKTANIKWTKLHSVSQLYMRNRPKSAKKKIFYIYI